MKTVEEIENAIEALPANDYIRLREWLSEKDNEQWDNQIVESEEYKGKTN